MTALPAWAATPEARALIAELQRDPPAYSVSRGQWIEGGGLRRYHGRTAARLRWLYDQAGDRLCAEADARFDAGVPWDEASVEFHAWCRESADQLIERLTDEPLAEVHGDPLRRAAA